MKFVVAFLTTVLLVVLVNSSDDPNRGNGSTSEGHYAKVGCRYPPCSHGKIVTICEICSKNFTGDRPAPVPNTPVDASPSKGACPK